MNSIFFKFQKKTKRNHHRPFLTGVTQFPFSMSGAQTISKSVLVYLLPLLFGDSYKEEMEDWDM